MFQVIISNYQLEFIMKKQEYPLISYTFGSLCEKIEIVYISNTQQGPASSVNTPFAGPLLLISRQRRDYNLSICAIRILRFSTSYQV